MNNAYNYSSNIDENSIDDDQNSNDYRASTSGRKINNKLRIPILILKRVDKKIIAFKNIKVEVSQNENALNDIVPCEKGVKTVPFEFEEENFNLFHIQKIWSLSNDERIAFEVSDEINIGSGASNIKQTLNNSTQDTKDFTISAIKHTYNDSINFNIEKVWILVEDENKDLNKRDEIKTEIDTDSSNMDKACDLSELPQIVIENDGNPVYFLDHKRQYKCPLCCRPLNELQKAVRHINEMTSFICDCGLVIYQDLSTEYMHSDNIIINHTEPQNDIEYKLCDSSSVDSKNDTPNDISTLDLKTQCKTDLDKCKEKTNYRVKNINFDKKYHRVDISKLKESEVIKSERIYFKAGYLSKVKVEEIKNPDNSSLMEDIAECDTSLYVVQDVNDSENIHLSTGFEIKETVALAIDKNRNNSENNDYFSKADSFQFSSESNDEQILGAEICRTLNTNIESIPNNNNISKRNNLELYSNQNDVTERINNKKSIDTQGKQTFIRKKSCMKIKNHHQRDMPQISKAIKKNHDPIMKKEYIRTGCDKGYKNKNNYYSVKNDNKKNALSVCKKKKNLKQQKLILEKLNENKINNSTVKCAVNKLENKCMVKQEIVIKKDNLKHPRLSLEKLDEKLILSLNCKYTKKTNKKTVKYNVDKFENAGIIKKEKLKENSNKIQTSISNVKGIRCSSRQRIEPLCYPAYDHLGRFIHKDVWGNMSAREMEVSQIKLEQL